MLTRLEKCDILKSEHCHCAQKQRCLFPPIVGATIGRPPAQSKNGRPMVAPTWFARRSGSPKRECKAAAGASPRPTVCRGSLQTGRDRRPRRSAPHQSKKAGDQWSPLHGLRRICTYYAIPAQTKKNREHSSRFFFYKIKTARRRCAGRIAKDACGIMAKGQPPAGRQEPR